MIAVDDQPFNVVENPGFINLLIKKLSTYQFKGKVHDENVWNVPSQREKKFRGLIKNLNFRQNNNSQRIKIEINRHKRRCCAEFVIISRLFIDVRSKFQRRGGEFAKFDVDFANHRDGTGHFNLERIIRESKE
uniref:Uncharacterized protein n=1 Tax=Romanomermis culicivorax TaxID=13658 RepID=A0A915HXY5_ROMCU